MFNATPQLTSVGDLSTWDVRGVSKLSDGTSSMFSQSAVKDLPTWYRG